MVQQLSEEPKVCGFNIVMYPSFQITKQKQNMIFLLGRNELLFVVWLRCEF